MGNLIKQIKEKTLRYFILAGFLHFGKILRLFDLRSDKIHLACQLHVREFALCLSTWWTRRIRIINENYSQKTSNNSPYNEITDSFYLLDHHSEDCIELQRGNNSKGDYLWNTHFGENFIFKPRFSKKACYKIAHSKNGLLFQTETKENSWLYLVSKKTHRRNFTIDFDFNLDRPIKESLQICFYAQSLTQRFRFIVNNEQEMKFEVVDKGFFFSGLASEDWDKFTKPCKLNFNQTNHIQLVVQNNRFYLTINDLFKLGIEIKKQMPKSGHIFLIFWNGLYDKEAFSVKIENLKIQED